MRARHRPALAAVGLLALLALAGCSSETAPGGDQGGAAAPELGHVHGLGTDPDDGTVYVASHVGVFAVDPDGHAERVADRWQDTMGFAVVGPGHFLASGHPDLREDLPVHLGLIESRDGAQTWTPVSLQGEADFHSIEASPDRVFGYDSVSGRLLVTEDRRTWRTLARRPVFDLAADPGEAAAVLASTPEGEVVEYRADGGAGRRLSGAPPVALLDWPEPDLLVGVAAGGEVYRSSDGGAGWQRVEGPPGQPQALDVTERHWVIATSEGVFRSEDSGRKWESLTG